MFALKVSLHEASMYLRLCVADPAGFQNDLIGHERKFSKDTTW